MFILGPAPLWDQGLPVEQKKNARKRNDEKSGWRYGG